MPSKTNPTDCEIVNVLYIHGFNSSPLSLKAELTKQYLLQFNDKVLFHCPQLKSSPDEAIRQLETIILSEPQQQWFLVGSSLGGYFSTYLAEKYNLRAVLINPAVRPFDLLVDYLGQQENPYTNEVYQVTEKHMHQLKSSFCEKISQKQYMVMVQTGDEVLDYQQAVDKYHGCQLIVQSGGDHSFVNYQVMLSAMMNFLSPQLTQQPLSLS